MQLLSSRDQTVTQESQLDPSLPCQGLAHDGPNLMDIFLNSRAGGKWGSALSSVRLLNQHTEGVQVKSVPQLKFKEAKSKCSDASSILDAKSLLFPAFGKI